MLIPRYLINAVLVMILAALGSALAQADHQMPMGSGEALEELEGEDFEVAFITMMTAHHQGAVEMAEWILERSDNPDLQTAAEAVIAAQQPEIDRMAQWLQEWYGQEVDPTLTASMQTEMTTMLNAMNAGADADVAFLEEMTTHHMSAIDMAQLALLRATNAELRALARDIIVAQAQEVYQYQEWLAEASPHKGH